MATVVTVVVSLGLAVFLCAHVSIAAGLARRRLWGRALACLVLPPLAPWWGWEEGMRVRSLAWVGALVVYTGGVIAA